MIDSRTRFAGFNALVSKLGRASAILALALTAIWAELAILFQAPLPQWPRLAIATAFAGVFFAAALSIWFWRGLRWTVPAAAAFGLVLAFWWSGIRPSDTREWLPESSRRSLITLRGDDVEVRNARTFRWSGPDSGAAAWEDRLYSLSDLTALDLFVSTWGNDNIAHTMVSFVFGSGPPLVLSMEIRKEINEQYSPLGGFFKKFELNLIAADESDIVKVRTNFRGETVRRYRIDVKPETAARLLVEFAALSQDLERAPQFYHSLWTNCTTTVFSMIRRLSPGDFPLDRRVIISGKAPEYLYDRGFIDQSQPFDELRRRADITMRAKLAGGSDFSTAIRR